MSKESNELLFNATNDLKVSKSKIIPTKVNKLLKPKLKSLLTEKEKINEIKEIKEENSIKLLKNKNKNKNSIKSNKLKNKIWNLYKKQIINDLIIETKTKSENKNKNNKIIIETKIKNENMISKIKKKEELYNCIRTKDYKCIESLRERSSIRPWSYLNELSKSSINNRKITKLNKFVNKSSLDIRAKKLKFDKSNIHSWGVFALNDIASNEFIVEYMGEYIGNKIADIREKEYRNDNLDDYMFRVDSSLIIDATKKGNIARFINHSCEPNCRTEIIPEKSKKVVIYAKKDIKRGEELTYDYKFPIEEDNKIPCLCGTPSCKKFLN